LFYFKKESVSENKTKLKLTKYVKEISKKRTRENLFSKIEKKTKNLKSILK